MTKIMPITDFIRNFGAYSDLLPSLDKLILTREGRPFAEMKATPEAKSEARKKFAGIWAGTDLDNDKFWAKVLKKTSRKRKIIL